ncbi:MAG: glycosyltransferase family 2 protein [Terrimicrobiaceae bacterium]
MIPAPCVTVCIPVYNGAKYLRACLESLAVQQWAPIEVIVCDDCSEDNSLDIAKDAAARHNHIRWVIQASDSRLGMVANWNRCIALATGVFVKVMGQDDILADGCLSHQAQILSKDGAVLTACQRYLLSEDGKRSFALPRKLPFGQLQREDIIFDFLHKGRNPIGEPVTVLFRADAFNKSGGGFNPRYLYWVDVEMWFRLLKHGSCHISSKHLCSFRIHRNAMSFSCQNISLSEFLSLRAEIAGAGTSSLRAASHVIADTIGRSLIYKLFA